MSRQRINLSLLIASRIDQSKPDAVENDFRNVSGRIVTVGDIHGAAAFSSVLESLGENDRLVLVGDLMDRGKETFDVLNKIVHGPHKDKIFAVRGNHEEMFLQYMSVRRKHENGERISAQDIATEESFIRNGGGWAKEKTLEELESIATYIDSLPYIRRVSLPNNQKFLVCHADMSMISDADVNQLIDGVPLTDQGKAILTWARATNNAEIPYRSYVSVRTANDTVVYTGHEITTRPGVSVVRSETNHVNLDFGAYQGCPLVGVEHPNKVVMFGDFGSDISPGYKELYFKQLVKLHLHIGGIEFKSDAVLASYKAALASPGFFRHVQLTQTQVDQLTFDNQKPNLEGAILFLDNPDLNGFRESYPGAKLGFSSRAQFDAAISTLGNPRPEKIDLSHCVFNFDDFTGFDFAGCQFVPSLSQNSPGQSVGADDFVEVEAPSEKIQHAVFLKAPDFNDAVNLTKETFPSDYRDGILSVGYRNDGGVLNPVTLKDCIDSIRTLGGLTEAQMCAVIEHASIDVPNLKKEHGVVLVSQNGKRASYTIHSSDQGGVLNVERVFSTGKKELSDAFPQSIDVRQLQNLFQSLNQQGEKVDCIQLPMKLESGFRKHYIQVQIFKKDDQTIGARIIDSTGNPIAIGDAQKALESLLENEKKNIGALFGMITISAPRVDKVTVMHTGVQPMRYDKRCGVYIMAGIRETVNQVLTNGVGCLKDDASVKAMVTKAHHHVFDGAYLQEYSDKNLVMPTGDEEKTVDQKILAFVEKRVESRARNRADAPMAERMIVTPNQGRFIAAVTDALENYQKKHNMVSRNLFHSQGSGYVVRALNRLNEAPSEKKFQIAKQICSDILYAGVKRDAQGDITIKAVNSRMNCLLSELARNGFIEEGWQKGVSLQSVQEDVGVGAAVPVSPR